MSSIGADPTPAISKPNREIANDSFKEAIRGQRQLFRETIHPDPFIRIQKRTANRVLYVAKFANEIHVLHCFIKKTQKTDPKDIEIARKRYGALVEALKKSRKKP